MWPSIIIARQIAARRVKAQLAAQGIKLRQVKALDIKRWADVYLDQHTELLAEAEAIIEASPELKIAERERKRMAKTTRVAGNEASAAKPLPGTVRNDPNFRTLPLSDHTKHKVSPLCTAPSQRQ